MSGKQIYINTINIQDTPTSTVGTISSSNGNITISSDVNLNNNFLINAAGVGTSLTLTNNLLTLKDSSNTTLSSVTLEIGPTGPTGRDGQDGAQGVQGEIGPTGPTGRDGQDGAQGVQGEIGPTGPTGRDGQDGAQGVQGEIGPTGPTGRDGQDGAQGPMGPAGRDGKDATDVIQYDYSDENFIKTKKVVNKNLTSNYLLTTDDIICSSVTNPYFPVTYTFGTSRDKEMYLMGCINKSGSDPTMAYSYNGIDWFDVPNSLTIFSQRTNDIAYNGNMWVAVGRGINLITYSYNGLNWIPGILPFTSTSTSEIQFVKTNGKIWIATGRISSNVSGGIILYSEDGITWFGSGINPTVPMFDGVITTHYGQPEWNGTYWAIPCCNIFNNIRHLNMVISHTGYTFTFPRELVNLFSISSSSEIDFTRTLLKWNGYVFLLAVAGVNNIGYYFGIYNPVLNQFYNSGFNVPTFNVYSLNWIDNVWVLSGSDTDSSGTKYRLYSTPCLTGFGQYTITNWHTYSPVNAIHDLQGSAVLLSFYDGKNHFVADDSGEMSISINNDDSEFSGFLKIKKSTSYPICMNYTGNLKEHSITTSHTSNLWIASGEGTNTLAYSYDGINWKGTGTTNGFNFRCRNVATDGKMWVASGSWLPGSGGIVSNNNTLIYSYDGINWLGGDITYTKIFQQQGNDIAWNGKLWVGCGSLANTFGQHTLGYSYNGVVWIGAGTSIFSQAGYGLKWNDTMWICAGQGTNNTLARSTDGISWIGLGKTVFSEYGHDVEWNGSMWIAVGSGTNHTIARSSDGINWIGLGKTVFSSAGLGIAYGNNMWIAGGEGTANTMAYSYDGINWIGLGKTIFTASCTSIHWNGDKWVAVGSGTTNTLAYSYNGINWIGSGKTVFTGAGYGIVFTPQNEPIIKINTKMVAGGSGQNDTLAYSEDGISWTGLGKTIFSTSCNYVLWNGSIWIAGGAGTNNTLAYSYNGINWIGLGRSIFFNAVNCVGWNDSMWVAGGLDSNNTIAYSYDGINWIGLGNIIFSLGTYSVYWSADMWLVGGEGNTNTMAYSYDGINWIGLGNIIFSTSCRSLYYNGSIWVAGGAGTNNTLAYSYDGINWTGSGRSVFSTACYSVSWNDNMWVAAGQGNNTLAYSYDGINWVGLGSTIFSSSCSSVTWNGNMWVAGGAGTNSLAYSYDGINWVGLGATLMNLVSSTYGFINALPLRKGDKLTICGPEYYDTTLNQDVSLNFTMKETTLIPHTAKNRFYYSRAQFNYTRNTTYNVQILPTIVGKKFKYYTITPSLPTGITFNNLTGLITVGSTSNVISNVTYSIKGYSGRDSYKFKLNITVA